MRRRFRATQFAPAEHHTSLRLAGQHHDNSHRESNDRHDDARGQDSATAAGWRRPGSRSGAQPFHGFIAFTAQNVQLSLQRGQPFTGCGRVITLLPQRFELANGRFAPLAQGRHFLAQLFRFGEQAAPFLGELLPQLIDT